MESWNWLLTVNCSRSLRSPPLAPLAMWRVLDVTGLVVLVREAAHNVGPGLEPRR